jgi:hypothetical protein
LSNLRLPCKRPTYTPRSVDNLKDIGDLKTYIERTDVIQIFLSKGYFGSRNCSREVSATLEQHTPYILVQEIDAAKGGASLQALQLELTDVDQRRRLFDGRSATHWYRIQEFQVVCSPEHNQAHVCPVPLTPTLETSHGHLSLTVSWAFGAGGLAA